MDTNNSNPVLAAERQKLLSILHGNAVLRELDEAHGPITDAWKASERLTENDFAIRMARNE